MPDVDLTLSLPMQQSMKCANETHVARPETPLLLAGYEIREVIGRGGMGEIVLAYDPEIGRDVAIKRMKNAMPSADSFARFLREAKIQARLDHPAIVPVHELGRDASGRPYFAMKRLTGKTMLDVIRTANEKVLLRAFVDICLAIDFAHSRGVIHRDVKPSNIVLGDYGEVYLLDWGVARLLDEADGLAAGDIMTLEGNTQVGSILGTPGYMAPEQMRGAEDIGRSADVYALGAILFEILSGEPLHPQDNGGTPRMIAYPAAAPSTKRASVAPELDVACVAALAEDPTARPTARALADRVQQYLDGDRDVVQRRKLALESLARACEAIAANDRAQAMNAAGRALSLDPESKDAAMLVTQLIVELPRILPAALKAHLDVIDLDMTLRSAKVGAFSFLSFFLFVPILVWNGIKDLGVILAIFASVGVVSSFAWDMYRKRRPRILITLFLNAAFMVLFSRLFGVFLVMPGIIVMMTMGMLALIDRPWLVIGAMLVPLVVPLLLEWSGLVRATLHFERDQLVVASSVLPLHGTSTLVLLICANVILLLVTCLFSRQVLGARRDALHRLEIQAWHLRALLPRTG